MHYISPALLALGSLLIIFVTAQWGHSNLHWRISMEKSEKRVGAEVEQ